MSIRECLGALVVTTAVAVGCESRGSLPASPSDVGKANTVSIAAPGSGPQVLTVTEHAHTVMLSDGCDPDTFNAPPPVGVGPGTCVRPGGVPFPKFVDELTRHHSVGAWHMAPGEVTLKVGEVLSALNHGGEAHSFTEVEEFGGGNVPFINGLMGLTTVASECAQAQLLQPGQSSSEVENEEGVEKYQCCIHPWMRAEVRVVTNR